MLKVKAVPATVRFRSEIDRARTLGFGLQVRVEPGVPHAAFARLVPQTKRAAQLCVAHGGRAVEARQTFDNVQDHADAIESAILAALDMVQTADA